MTLIKLTISKVPDTGMSEINSGYAEFTDIYLISIKVIFLLGDLSTCFNLFFLDVAGYSAG